MSTRGPSELWHGSPAIFETFYEHAPDALVIVGEDGTIERVNAQAEALFQISRDRLVGQRVESLLPERFRDRHVALRNSYMRHPRARAMGTDLKLLARRADGAEVPVDVMLSPVEVDGRTVVMAVVRDISERRRVEAERDDAEHELRCTVQRYRDLSRTLEARVKERTREAVARRRECDETDRKLREANEVFRAMYERGGIFMARLDRDGVVLDANPACVEELGFERAEVVGHPVWKSRWWCRSRQAADWVRDGFDRALSGERFRGETGYVTGTGDERIADLSMIPIRDDGGRVASVFMGGVDVTERARQYRATFENAAVGIAHISADLTWVRVNEALSETLGYPPGELLARPFLDVVHPDDRDAIRDALSLAHCGQTDSFEVEKRLRRRDGADIWARQSVGSVCRCDGAVDYFVAVIQDISRRKRAEEDLHNSEVRFKTAVLRAPVPLLLFTEDEEIVAVSESWIRNSGYARDELHTIGDWTARAYRERSDEVLRYLREIIATNPDLVRRDWTIRTQCGLRRQWSFVSSALGPQSDGRRLFVTVAQDITERTAYEEQIDLLLREARHRTKNILGLVQTVARQTVAHDPEGFLESFCERIGALAANQDLLVKNQWHGADVEDLVRAQLAHFGDLVGSRICLRGPKLRLNAAAAQAVGLAVHELATNAGKYGALSTDCGRVDVCWRCDADTFAIGWTEHGGPRVKPPKHRGFGSTVIETLAERSVSGQVKLDYAPGGLRWHLTCPQATALEHGEGDARRAGTVVPPASRSQPEAMPSGL